MSDSPTADAEGTGACDGGAEVAGWPTDLAGVGAAGATEYEGGAAGVGVPEQAD